MVVQNHAYINTKGNEDLNSSISKRTALILYGSETGNSQDVAEEIGRLTQKLLFETVVLDLDSIQLRDLLKFSVVIFAVSTTGQGEFPQNARALWKALLSKALKPGVFRRLHFTSFGLGDSSYPRYNVAHRMLCGRLLQLGAKSFCERGEGNEQHPEGHSGGLREWIVLLKSALLSQFSLPDSASILPDDVFIEPRFKLMSSEKEANIPSDNSSKATPSTALLPVVDGYVADIDSTTRTTTDEHFQDVRLLDLSLDRPYDYGPGAVAVIYPKNFPEDVQAFIDLMNWQRIADQPVQLVMQGSSGDLVSPSPLRHLDTGQTSLTIRWLLENSLDIMSIPRRSFFATLLHFARADNEDEAYQKERLAELANPELIDELWDYTTRPKRTILEVMMDFTTIRIPWQYALSTLPIMRGRQFSIASGGHLTKHDSGRTRVQLLVAIVDPPSPIIKWRRRYGVCTRYIAALEKGQQLCIQMQKGYLDVQPSEIYSPVIMIGPGTGVAPLRSMIYQRSLWAKNDNKHLADTILFFGCRSSTADYFFKDEWPSLQESQHLQVYTAFSRDPSQVKRYVQDCILESAELVATTLLAQHSKIYICGSSGNMPKGVRTALVEALMTQPSYASKDAAELYLDTLEKGGRYKQETW